MNKTEIATFIAAFTAFGATVFLPVLKTFLGFQTTKLNDSASWREYLASELKKRDEKLEKLEEKFIKATEETEKWRDLYYEQLEINHDLEEKIVSLQQLVATNAGIVQDNANNVSIAMETAKQKINKI